MTIDSFATLTEFVNKSGGSNPINRVLIANNGIAAVKMIRSIRKWAYLTFQNDKIIEFVVMVTPEDLDANCEYIRLSDHFVEVPGGPNINNYANVDLIVQIAQKQNVQAVWAGWGHASENPSLPEQLAEVHPPIAFLGPSASAMRALGDKIASSIIAQSAGISTIPWSGSGLKFDYIDGENVAVPSSLYDRACISSVEDGLKVAEKIGMPIMIKASYGGGGKGIRKVLKLSDFKSAYRQVCSEIPDSPVFVMKLAVSVRHVEVQIISDLYGSVVSLYGRDCTVQRRHQKIIEEAPITMVPESVIKEMERSAINLAKMVNYTSAGTVEYLYDLVSQKFYFLELNPRLQVEHPCTEMIAGVNLPSLQLLVAMGIPLFRIKDICTLYGLEIGGFQPHELRVDFDVGLRKRPKGHVIAARITAEDPQCGFQPNNGTIEELNFRCSNEVWGYFSVGHSSRIHEFSDSQFGHVFSFGETREDARRNLIVALKELSIRSDFCTTVDYLIRILETASFINDEIHTDWLDGVISECRPFADSDPIPVVIMGALVKSCRHFELSEVEFMSRVEKGQEVKSNLLSSVYSTAINYNGVLYSVRVVRLALELFKVVMNDSAIIVQIRNLKDGSMLIHLDRYYSVYSKRKGCQLSLVIDGTMVFIDEEQNSQLLKSPSSGKLTRYLVKEGLLITPGTPYAEVEVMKMCLTLRSQQSGFIKYEKCQGDSIQAGETIASLILENPSEVADAIVFEGKLPKMKVPPTMTNLMEKYLHLFVGVFSGYNIVDDVEKLWFEIDSEVKRSNISAAELIEQCLKLVKKFVTLQEVFDVSKDSSIHCIRKLKLVETQDLLTVGRLFANRDLLDLFIVNLINFVDKHISHEIRFEFENTLRQVLLKSPKKPASYLRIISGIMSRSKNSNYLIEGNGETLCDRISTLTNVANMYPLPKIYNEVVPKIFDKNSITSEHAMHKYIHCLLGPFGVNIIPVENNCSSTYDHALFYWTCSDCCISAEIWGERQTIIKRGIVLKCSSLDRLESLVTELEPVFNEITYQEHVVLHLVLIENFNFDDYSRNVFAGLNRIKLFLQRFHVLRVVALGRMSDNRISYSTFAVGSDITEDCSLRNREFLFAPQVELERLKSFKLRPLLLNSTDPYIFVFEGTNCNLEERIFIRLVDYVQQLGKHDDSKFTSIEMKTSLDIGLTILELISRANDCNHLFINHVIDSSELSLNNLFDMVNGMKSAISLYLERLQQSRLNFIECKISLGNGSKAFRVHFKDLCVYDLEPSVYEEINGSEDSTMVLRAISGSNIFENKSAKFIYQPKSYLDTKRYHAHKLGTTYVYDFPRLFEEAIKHQWRDFPRPKDIFECKEMVFASSKTLAETCRPPGNNTIGVIAWLMTIKSPYENGMERRIIVIANDITFKTGSFGIEEDIFFLECSRYARKNGIPRIFISANSGARIGFAEEIRSIFKVMWKDVNDYSKGFDFIYLEDDDMVHLSNVVKDGQSVGDLIKSSPVVHGRRKVHRIDAIVGKDDGLGVENLQGSGMIAGETSKAYREIFTLSYIACRSVGIGAYLVRLGHRTIQNVAHPIILTGAQALNKVLGNDVYRSNLQLGGPQIMHNNGISQMVARNDLDGVIKIVEWLFYVPLVEETFPVFCPSIAAQTDPITRRLNCGEKHHRNVREMICGTNGLFDKDSFMETMPGWAKSVVTGRCRLGGMPVAVVAAEIDTTTEVISADPADSSSTEKVVYRAGQVWYPDSSYKTAQTINDAKNERLPLFILANWRGFSGGMQDMYNEVLKFGSMIVESLNQYDLPVFVYLPPYSELRGGAWVVLDPSINRNVMEIYADETAKGNVLEPEGTVAIKYRKEHIIKTINRVDPVCSSLYALVNPSVVNSGTDVEQIKKELHCRQQKLLPAFKQVALEFANLHDGSYRMTKKCAIDGVVSWSNAREFFYWRTRSRLIRLQFKDILSHELPTEIQSMSDRSFVEWFEGSRQSLKKLSRECALKRKKEEIVRALQDNPEIIQDVIDCVKDIQLASRD